MYDLKPLTLIVTIAFPKKEGGGEATAPMKGHVAVVGPRRDVTRDERDFLAVE